jgi:phytoene/squalene synthetase
MEIYNRLLRKIVRRKYDVFGNTVRLSGSEKASVVLKALAMKYIPGREKNLPPINTD